MLWGSWALFSGIERSFTHGSQERQVRINVDTPRNYSLEQTAALFEEVRQLLEPRREELEIADIVYEYDRRSGRSRGGWGGGRRFEIFLKDEDESTRTTREITDEIRRLLPVKAGVEFRIAQSQGRGGGGSGISLEVSGDDIGVLKLVAEKVASALADSCPGSRTWTPPWTAATTRSTWSPGEPGPCSRDSAPRRWRTRSRAPSPRGR